MCSLHPFSFDYKCLSFFYFINKRKIKNISMVYFKEYQFIFLLMLTTLLENNSPILQIDLMGWLNMENPIVFYSSLIRIKNSLMVKKADSRKCSTNSKNSAPSIDWASFIEWFRGFTDAEGCFFIKPTKGVHFGFCFSVGLHVDDIKVLEFIQKKLQMGKIYTKGSMATLLVQQQDNIKIIIDIFEAAPLNSIKQLNFLDFKKAFELYTSSDKNLEVKKQIDVIIRKMNNQRSDYEWPSELKRGFKFSNYWLLGFVEGDASFIVGSQGNFRLAFNISQSSRDLALMTELKNYLNDVATAQSVNIKGRRNFVGGVSLSVSERVNKPNTTSQVNIYVYNTKFINIVLIPLFDSLIWQSKKLLDFKDWKQVAKLKEKGLHFTDEGKELIKWIIGQMNSKRLSTHASGGYTKAGNNTLESKMHALIEKLLNGPSNFEIRENGRIFIKSLNKYYSARDSLSIELQNIDGLVVKTFGSMAETARYFGVDPKTVKYWIQNNKSVPTRHLKDDLLSEGADNKFLVISDCD